MMLKVRVKAHSHNVRLTCAGAADVCVATSVTRLGDLFDFGQVFKAFGNNQFIQISHILRQFCTGVKIIIFLVKSFLDNFL